MAAAFSAEVVPLYSEAGGVVFTSRFSHEVQYVHAVSSLWREKELGDGAKV